MRPLDPQSPASFDSSPLEIPGSLPATEEITVDGLADLLAEPIPSDDPVARRIVASIEEDIRASALEIPRLPYVAAPILEFVNNPRISTTEIVRTIRMDPALAGKILEVANSAVFAGSQTISGLSMAIRRLGLRKVSEVALELSSEMKVFHGRKRAAFLDRLWRQSLATAFACEALAEHVGREVRESAFLTGLFHAVASPAIVTTIGRLERRSPGIPSQSDERVLGLMNLLSTHLTIQVLESWCVPQEIPDAIRLQDVSFAERKGRALAHLLVCGKLLTWELGVVGKPQPIELARARDFGALRITDREVLNEASRSIHANLENLPKR
jgi:HD-like signal output (HDOD) protein